jgi:two-component system, NtrC family, nitrogen regulation sensor histidine kinase NtrY
VSSKAVALALSVVGVAFGALIGAVLSVALGAGPLGSAALTAGLAIAALVAWELIRRPAQSSAARQTRPSEATLVRDRMLQIIADSVPDAVVLFSDVGTIQYSNPVARELFFEGRVPEGQNFIRMVSAAAAPLREALLGETDRFFSVDVEGRRESYHLSRRTFVVDGEPLTLLVVKYMTREIHRREVEVLQRVVRVISHEVNNSLAPISSLIHSARMIATKDGIADRFQRIFDTIDGRASHLRVFLEGYAALARLPRPRLSETHWEHIFAQVSTLYPDLRLPPAPSEPGWFDGAQVEQLLINLLKNAREAGSPVEAIELSVKSGPEGASELEILDRGPGFSTEALQNALVPLYTTKPGGSGMGLALSREIALAHGGSLDVSNREGGGARVCVRLAGRKPQTARDLSRSRLTLTRG